jgi:zinc/manganese transport system substrate-binding protein
MFLTKNMIVWLSVILFCITPANAKEQIRIVAVTGDFAAIAKDIGGERVKVSALVSGSYNLHYVHPKPSMVQQVRYADIVIRLGMGQDTWVDSLMDVAGNSRILKGAPGYIDASRDIIALEVPSGNVDRRHGDIHIYGNPHYWLDPHNGKIIAKHILQQLRTLDPMHANMYEKNYAEFCRKLDTKIAEWRVLLAPLLHTRFITYHTVWSYFFNAFNLTSIGHLEPFPGISPSVPHLYRLTQTVKKQSNSVRVIGATYYPVSVGQSFANTIHSTYTPLPTNVGNSIHTYSELFDTIINELTQ